MQHRQRSTADRPVAGAVTALPDVVVGRESHGNASHGNAPAAAIRADGTETSTRFEINDPSFSNLRVFPAMAAGEVIADPVATLGSLDTILGEVDR